MAAQAVTAEARAALSGLLTNYTAEVTARDRKGLDAAPAMMAAGSEVYIAAIPGESEDRLVAAAAHLRENGMVPVPHIVARNIENRAGLDGLLRRLTAEAKLDRALVLGGDRDKPAGAFDSSLQLLETAAQSGLDVWMVSQFCFDAKPIIALARRMRAQGVTAPFRVGVAGPAERSTLVKYALMCGVGASLRALKERQDLARNVLTGETPEALLTEVAQAQERDPSLGIKGVHFFTFGALAKSAEWADRMMR